MTTNTFLFTLFLSSVCPPVLFGITTIHHDKPEDSQISQMATKMKEANRNVPLNVSTVLLERQKRLLPYINYYLSRNNQQRTDIEPNYRAINQERKNKLKQPIRALFRQNEKFTPFLESNAIPGPFIPIIKSNQRNKEAEYEPQLPEVQKNPDYSVIYDTLARLKQTQQLSRPFTPQQPNPNPVYRKDQINFVPITHYDTQPYRDMKTVIETYTPTNIDIPDDKKNHENIRRPINNYNEGLIYKVYRPTPQVNQQYITEIPQHDYKTEVYESTIVPDPKSYYVDKSTVKAPLILYQHEISGDNPFANQGRKEYTQNERPITYITQTTSKPQVKTIIDDKFIAQKYTVLTPTQDVQYENVQIKQYAPVQFASKKYEEEYFSTPAPNTIPTEGTNNLGKILKQLQNSNTLPQTLTPENIDNSIKTLVKILNELRERQRLLTKPIVVEDVDDDSGDDLIKQPKYGPGTVTQVFPANTVEGGTPGRPGIDYPALSSIPQTSFNCKTQRYKGFFGDPHTNCQVWHYCDLNGGQASFLCPNGTIFSQVALTCDWWYNVKCSSTAQLYVLNERLYKYILPLAPKFPEDYSGPLVDKYLALKFQEMEEKMKSEKKKGKVEKSEEEKDDSDQLQDIQNEKAKASEKT